MKSDPFSCPVCGNSVSPNASGCGKCGAVKEDGQWIEPDSYDGIGLDDDDFDYDSFVEREFGTGPATKTRKEWFWWIVALITLLAFFVLAMGGW